MTYEWYKVYKNNVDKVTQGDIIYDCPVPNYIPKDEYPFYSVEGIVIDAIVVTQACDLENGVPKVKNITLCPIVPAGEIVKAIMEDANSQNPSFDYNNLSKNQKDKKKGFVEKIRQGSYLDYYLIDKHEDPSKPELNTGYKIVLLRDSFSIPVDAANQILESKGGERLRLQPPYREHLAQAYTFNFNRIGLPIDIRVNLDEI